MGSRVHPTDKTRYRVSNWREYERGLVQRGDITVWLSPDAVAAWTAKPNGRRGAQPKISSLAIETAIALRLIFHLTLRQAEGFLRSALKLKVVDLEASDYTTLSRRSATLHVALTQPASKGAIDLIIDSSGLATASEGEWAATKHGEIRRRCLGNSTSGLVPLARSSRRSERPQRRWRHFRRRDHRRCLRACSVCRCRRGLRHNARLPCCRSQRRGGRRPAISNSEHKWSKA